MTQLFSALLSVTMLVVFIPKANATIESDVLELLIRESATITLIDTETGAALNEQLPALIARALTGGYQSFVPTEANAILSNVNTSCRLQVQTPASSTQSTYLCQVVFADATFSVVSGKIDFSKGAESESGTVLEFEVIQDLTAPIKPVLKKTTINATLAG